MANELLGYYYPRTELDSLLTATLTQYWTSGRTQTEIDDAVAGLLDQATADARCLVRPPGPASGTIFQLVQNQVFPPVIRNLLLRSPLTGANVLGNLSTLKINCDCWSKSEADSRYISTSDLSPLDARYFVREPFPEGNGIFSMVQEQFTPRVIRSLLPGLSARAILGNFSTLELECDCWSKAATPWWPIDGRVSTLENSGGIAPTADLTVNSLTAASFVETTLLQSAAADLQIQNATTTIRATLLASFVAGSIGLEQDITVRSDRTLNATTADAGFHGLFWHVSRWGGFRVCSSVLAFLGISNCSCSVLGPSRLPYRLGDRIRPGKAKNRSRMMLFSSFLLHLMRFKTKAQIRNSRLSLFGEFSD